MLMSKLLTSKCRRSPRRAAAPLRQIKIFSLLFCFATSLASPLHAEHTRTWRQSTYEDFLKGTATGVAVRSDGRLELSPRFQLLSDADASYLWSVRVDPKGTLYAAGGSPAKVFRFDANGKPTTAFESTDLAAQAIAFDSKGALYVGTSPDGKVYKVSASGEKSIFFDPKTKYIWDLAFGADGTLYVATGDKGQVFAVAPNGKSELFYNSDEAHIRVLAFDPQGNLIAGTEPSGRVLRITRDGRKDPRKDRAEKDTAAATGFVLYETAKREVTSIAVAPGGNIYVSAIGEKQRSASGGTTIITTSQGVTTITGGGAIGGGTQQNQTPFIPFPPLLSSSIYKVSPNGAPEELWTSRDDVVYALALNSDGRLLAGTGNSGSLLAVDGRGVFAQLAKSGAAQITGITRSASGKIYLCTANPGKVFALGPEYEPEGTYESRSFDAQLFSQWGRLDWWSPPPTPSAIAKPTGASAGPRVEFFARSGNTEDPGKEWSRWFGPYSKPGSNMEIPPARFVQWKTVIHDGRPGDGIDWVSVAYLPRNVAPAIDGIVVQDPGTRVQGAALLQTGQQPSANLRMPPSFSSGIVMAPTPQTHFEQAPQGFQQKGYLSVLWTAHDDNDDELRYTVYYRGEGETQWKPLKDKLDQKFFSWDATSLPDGAYYLKITASDSSTNPPDVALSTERESERFVVDNTPPEVKIQGVVSDSAAAGGRVTVVQFTARDTTSSIERAQYSVDGGDWILVAPAGNISDAPEERYEIKLTGLATGEHSVAVRAYDHFDNVGSAKTTLQASAARP
jgi:outer membrane protein assembly factor BamB